MNGVYTLDSLVKYPVWRHWAAQLPVQLARSVPLLVCEIALNGACGPQAAKAGARSRLFLLDEVDAALDESNQAVVASLMRQLCGQQGGCQCLAVTHSAAFQANCDALVQVFRGPDGTTFAAAGSEMQTNRKRSRKEASHHT